MNMQKFNEKVDANIYFSLKGCQQKGFVKLPKTLFNFIYNVSGTCTDEAETEDFYKNPRAMFVALDLIYELCDAIEKSKEG